MRALALLLALTLLGACSSPGTEAPAEGPDPAPTTSPAPFAEPSEDPAPEAREMPEDATIRASAACTKVRAGIEAFNDGDFEATVARFADAEPLAALALERAAATPREERWALLLEAVQYYAVLAPDDYLDAAATSPDFARWKSVTLGLCVVGGTLDPQNPETPPQQV